MDIAVIIGTIISAFSAAFAGWQAIEATKARKSASASQADAAKSSNRAAHSAQIAAEAQRKIAAAQEEISNIIKKRQAANRRNVFLRHVKGKFYVVVNDSGETITRVEVVPTKTDQGTLMRAPVAESLSHGDSHEVFLPCRGMYEIHWVDTDGVEHEKSAHTVT